MKKHPSVRIQDPTQSSVPSKSLDVETDFEKNAKFTDSEKNRFISNPTDTAQDIEPGPSTSETSSTLSAVPLKTKSVLRQQQLQVPRKLGLQSKKNIDDKLLQLVVKDIQPFSIVEDIGFREFCHELNPSYCLPSRKTLSKTLLPAKYLETINKTKEIISAAESVTITTDMWTSRNGDSFNGVTAHFINTHFEIKSLLLEVSVFEGAHTSANLARELRSIVTEWGVQDKILLAISDNAANIKKAILEELKWKHFGCLAHTINLIAQDGLKSIEDLIEKVKNIVSFFKRSNLAKERLDSFQKQNNKSPKKLIQSVPTRWNSVFYMLERILELKEEVRASLAVLGHENLHLLTNNDFEDLSQLVNILKPLESATKLMSGEKYVTLSSVIIISNGLEKIYSRLVSKIELSTVELSDKTKTVVVNIFKSIQHRLKNLEMSSTLMVSTFLDPRFKNIGFSSEHVSEKAKTLVTNLLTSFIERHSQETTVSGSQSQQQTDVVPDEFSIWSDFDHQASLFKPVGGNSRSKAIIEIQRFLEEPLLNRECDPLNWWKINKYNFPNLSKIVRQKFGTVSTSVPCERLFSKTGQILSERRNRLSVDKVKQVMFIKNNA
ncbi:unnamed protein product [Psylliodes chrysocephalus]|uniref:HAT C-terminal dimerisation domain-containing protein n=1 Tax=Psylliodes chrysocephalus TaxID=3402493 RepID=A0A9P0CGC2_9CUCU|nr:unnamed protein product [Psylliodes chrysocephala]